MYDNNIITDIYVNILPAVLNLKPKQIPEHSTFSTWNCNEYSACIFFLPRLYSFVPTAVISVITLNCA